MTRKSLTALVVALMFICLAGGAARGQQTGQPGMSQSAGNQAAPRITINGAELVTDVQPMWKDGIAFIALSDLVSDSLGAVLLVENQEPLAASLRTPEGVIAFTEGLTLFSARGIDSELPVAPFQQGGYLMVPARELLEALGFSVVSDEKKNSVEAKINAPSAAVPRDIVDAIFAVKPERHATATTTAAPQQAAGPLEYTYDNTISFDNTAVSGASDLSNLSRATAFNNQFNMRMQKPLANGYKFSGNIRTSETTDSDFNMGRSDKLALSLAKGGITFSLVDFTPKFTYYALKNYLVRGLQYERKGRILAWTALWGKSPKIVGDSEYARYIQGFRTMRSRAKDRGLGISFVRTRDAGGPRTTERYDNRITTVNGNTTYKKTVKLMSEYAVSTTNIDDGPAINSTARTVQAQYRDRQTLCTAVYDRTGAGFDSETTYFTAGRREASTLCNRKLNQRTLLGTGYKKVLLGGEETRTLPFFYSVFPLKARPSMKLTAQKNFEKASGGGGPRITDLRSTSYADVFGKLKFDATFDRRKQKDANNIVAFRNSQRFRLNTFITKKTELVFQSKKELRTRGSNPRTRFNQLRLDHELKPWNDLSFSISRYYNGTANNRSDCSVSFRKVNIETDTEMNLEYRFLNYRDHNDNVVKLQYSFLK